MPALLLKRFLAFVIDLALIVDYAVVLFLAGNFQTNNAKEKMVMPNHFHFQLYLTKHSLVEKQVGSITVPAVSEGFRQLLSSYTLAMNREYARSGSLFRQKTKKKLLKRNGEYPFICFQYIHQNPLTAGLVGKMEEWEFSSFNDYVGIRHGNLCDQNLAYELLDLSRDTFYQESYSVISPEKVKGLY